jgi:phosphoribosyl 1,2-cyclic phosphodiesterase
MEFIGDGSRRTDGIGYPGWYIAQIYKNEKYIVLRLFEFTSIDWLMKHLSSLPSEQPPGTGFFRFFASMSLRLASLNSGSNGNCYYIGNGQDSVLVDAGISCRETDRRMRRLGLSLNGIRAIFISHEHTDHTRGVEVISRKFGIPVYITQKTHHQSRLSIARTLLKTFTPDAPVDIGTLSIKAFRKNHDASDPHSFTVTGNGITAGVFTDIGAPCGQLTSHLSECHAAFLETNYDEWMLDHGPYPLNLKRRIRSDVGHLSNRQALELFLAHKAPFMSLLILSHLSAENNHPDLVRNLFVQHASGTRIAVASRYKETELFEVFP